MTFTDVLPSVDVTKTANDNSVPETGQDVTFTFLVHNLSTESATITVLSDSDFGTLAGDADCQVGTVLAAGASCSFEETHTIAGDFGGPDHVNTFTATVADDDGNTDSDSDDETVTFTDVLPTIHVEKDAGSFAVDEPGATVTYTVTVENTSDEAVWLVSLSDNKFGDLDGQGDCVADGTVKIDAGDTYSCTFDAFVGGDAGDTHVNTVTATARDDEQNPAFDSDDATVNIVNVDPQIVVTKTADPTTVDEPGADVSYTVTVTNNSVETVWLTSLIDDKFGDLDGQGDCVADGTVKIEVDDTYTCTFVGQVAGDAGDTHENTVIATVVDNDENEASNFADATVTIQDVLPTITVVKDATPGSVGPGGSATFTVNVTNDSPESVWLTSLIDDIHGDLDGQGNCVADGTGVILAGATYTCSFSAVIVAAAGSSETDTVTATVMDNEENTASDEDTAVVAVVDLSILKSVSNTTADRGTVLIDSVPVIKSRPGDVLHYTLNYTVTGDELTGVVIVDVLPAGLGTPTNISNGGVYADGKITWNLGTVTASGSVGYDMVVAVGANDLPQPLRNTATIDSDQTAPDSSTASTAVEIPPLGETDVPVVPTLPPTSTIDDASRATPGASLWIVLVALAGLAFLASYVVPAAARSRRRR